MSSRCTTLLLLVLALLSPFAMASESEDKPSKVGDHTIERTIQLRTHSLYAPYIDQDLQNRWWDFGADSYVNTNKHVRLTRPAPSQMGWLWSRLPLTSTNYIIEVEFKISGESSHLFGDGIAVWIAKERAQPGPIFGNKDKFEGLGIFLDTYANSRHSYSFPHVTATLGDGKTEYDYGNDGDDSSIGGCSANFRRTNVATKLKITYIKEKYLDVKIQYKAWDDWSDCFHVENVTLPSAPFIGFSAMTGDVSDAHDIISVTSSSAILAPPTKPKSKSKSVFPSLRTSDDEDPEGSWFGSIFKLFLFIGVCVGGYYGYLEYKRRQAFAGAGNFGGMGGGGYGGGMYANSKRF
ncbi:hypothetical protein EYR40_007212 [Pleurotus pulmonarius]|nr:hypothetical protein EYR36_003508 [Pleurotus pulmonarius]KAF4600106.1 hypothetical protein EYR40_007212 [Pleurotus pulmonarius]